MKKRLDLFLTEKSLTASRTKAQDLIKASAVLVNGKMASSSSQQVSDEDIIEILKSEETKYVSRGGLKLEGALKHTGLNPQKLRVLDVGISTGGFTDCLLKAGASEVVGIDVGQNQLHESLKSNSRVICLEKINAREMHKNIDVINLMPEGGWPVAVIDVSFISLYLILPAVFEVISMQGHVLALVKPQFEVGADGLNRQGIVKDVAAYDRIEGSMKHLSKQLGYMVKDYFQSAIDGKDGNREYFIYLQKVGP
jgi:23S rRNA (cytidine1920-2'-O)/16S rRNA (cytidine1409-2'-O)-methyltransferase